MREFQAMQDGFTVHAHICIGMYDLDLMVQPDTDFDSCFRAWDMDENEWLDVSGWLADNIEIEG